MWSKYNSSGANYLRTFKRGGGFNIKRKITSKKLTISSARFAITIKSVSLQALAIITALGVHAHLTADSRIEAFIDVCTGLVVVSKSEARGTRAFETDLHVCAFVRATARFQTAFVNT